MRPTALALTALLLASMSAPSLADPYPFEKDKTWSDCLKRAVVEIASYSSEPSDIIASAALGYCEADQNELQTALIEQYKSPQTMNSWMQLQIENQRNLLVLFAVRLKVRKPID